MASNEWNAKKSLRFIEPNNLAALKVRAPQMGKNGSGAPSVDFALNTCLRRYTGLLSTTLARMQCELPDARDWSFLRFALSSVFIEDLVLIESPTVYLSDISDAMSEYGAGAEPFTPALPVVLKRWGALEAVALLDWMERARLEKCQNAST